MIDYSPLGKAIEQLKLALDYYDQHKNGPDNNLKLLLRSAAIQAFEYTYELSVKMIKRYLEQAMSNPTDVDQMDFQQLIREAYERGLLTQELVVWKSFRAKRGITSHAYDSSKAEDVFMAIPSFLAEAESLYLKLNQNAER